MTGARNGSRVDASVLIATRDRAESIAIVLEDIARLDTAGATWEVIVVDNGSVDGTSRVLEAARDRLPLTVAREPRPGRNRAANLGLTLARGEHVLMTDDDVRLDAGWLREHLAASRRWPAHAVFAGPVTPIYPPGTPDWLSGHPFAGDAFGSYHPARDEGPVDVLPIGVNGAVRARALKGRRFRDDLGPRGGEWDLTMGETELFHRLTEGGERTVFVPTARVEHVIAGRQITHAWLMNRSFRIGRTMTHLDPDAASHRLLGAPLKLWARVPRHALLYGLAALRGERARFVAGLKLFRRRGQIYEYLSPDQRAGWGSWLLPPRQPSSPHAPSSPLGGQTSPRRDAAAPGSE